MSNGSADPNPTTTEWRVVDSYATGGGLRDSWRAIGPWRSTHEEAIRDAEHGSMRGALEPSPDDLTRLRAELDAYKREREELIRERDEARAEIERLRAAEERDAEYLEEVLRKHDEGSGIAICSWCALPTNSDEASKRAHQVSCPKSPLVAQLAEREAACAAMRFEIEGAQRHLRAAGNDYPSDLAVKDALEHVERALSSSAGAALLAEVERLRELTGVMQERLERFENIEDAARLVCEWAVTVAVDGSTVKSAARNYLSGLANDAALAPAPAAEAANVCGKRCDHGSECLRMAHDDGRHETQHGCVFHDAPVAAGKGPSHG